MCPKEVTQAAGEKPGTETQNDLPGVSAQGQCGSYCHQVLKVAPWARSFQRHPLPWKGCLRILSRTPILGRSPSQPTKVPGQATSGDLEMPYRTGTPGPGGEQQGRVPGVRFHLGRWAQGSDAGVYTGGTTVLSHRRLTRAGLGYLSQGLRMLGSFFPLRHGDNPSHSFPGPWACLGAGPLSR